MWAFLFIRNFFFVSLLLITAISFSRSQEYTHQRLKAELGEESIEKELNYLHVRLGLPMSVQITVVNSGTLPIPSTSPLKVFIATGSDLAQRAVFIKAIEKWNTRDGAKYGLLEIVPDLNQADLIVARFIDRDKATYDKRLAPLHAYLIRRKTDSLEILVHYKDVAPLYHDGISDYLVTDKLRTIMKKR